MILCKILICLILLKSSLGFLEFPSPVPFLDSLLQSISESDVNGNLTGSFTPGEECNRNCDSTKPKICYFEWIIELYPTLSGACNTCSKGVFEDCFHPQCVTGNGLERVFMSINRRLPSPPVEVCQNDLIVVDVHNEIEGSGTTIHWHGLAHENSMFMDGVPYITQCPIPFGSTFRYSFEAVEDGTFFYHSHAGHQKSNGVYGALVVRKPEKEKQKDFDHDLSEHVIVLSDWMNQMTEDLFPGVKGKNSHPESLLINGRGRSTSVNESINAVLSVFHVDEGDKYKFRIISATSNVCPIMLQIEDHNFTAVATDSIDVKPFIADTLYITSGERFDLIIHANQTIKDSHWIRIKAIEPCMDNDSIEEFAILRYHRKGDVVGERHNIMQVQSKVPDASLFPSLVAVNSPIPSTFPITLLESVISDKGLVESKPDKTFFLAFATPVIINKDVFSGQIFHKFFGFAVNGKPDLSFNSIGTVNNISFMFPEVPLLSQPAEIDESTFCNITHQESAKCYESQDCFCQHRLMAPERSIVEFVLMNTGALISAMAHPFHLHGHHFAVIEVGVFNETFGEAELKKHVEKPIRLKKNPVYKDTVFIPKQGYARLRYRSRSANIMFFHCHIDFHLEIGMAGILQIGDLKDLPKPPENFPQCRRYIPKI